MWLILLAYLCLLLKDLEGEPPLFHPQHEGTPPHYAYYLCYRYPRPNYWIDRLRYFIG